MDAALASLEGKVGEVRADISVKASKALADPRSKRDQFRDAVEKCAQGQSLEAACS